MARGRIRSVVLIPGLFPEDRGRGNAQLPGRLVRQADAVRFQKKVLGTMRLIGFLYLLFRDRRVTRDRNANNEACMRACAYVCM